MSSYLNIFAQINSPHLLQSEVERLKAMTIDPPFPAVTAPTEQEAPNHNGAVAVLPLVNEMYGDEE